MQTMDTVDISTANPLARSLGLPVIPPAVRRPVKRRWRCTWDAFVEWQANWSNRGNVLNFISVASYFPLNFAHGHGVKFDAKVLSVLYSEVLQCTWLSGVTYWRQLIPTPDPPLL